MDVPTAEAPHKVEIATVKAMQQRQLHMLDHACVFQLQGRNAVESTEVLIQF